MRLAILFALSLTMDANAGPPSQPDRATYERAVESAGRDSATQVNLALWCEAHGMSAERMKHLARAVLIDPKNATARGLMGLVAYHGRWNRPEAVAEKVKADAALAAKLAEYNARRAGSKETADSQAALAHWCDQNGLEAEAKAHYSAVVRLDPKREAAWKKLGCKKVGGRWVTTEQLAAEKAESEAQKAADKKWKPLLTKYRDALSNRSESKRSDAEKALDELTDPRAVPSVWAVFVQGAKDHLAGVRLLGQIDAAASSRALAFLSVSDQNPEVRRAATEILRRRDPREFAGLLVALLREPIRYEIKPVGGPGSPGALFITGKQMNLQRVYAPPAMPMIGTGFRDVVVFDNDGLPMISRTGIGPLVNPDQWLGERVTGPEARQLVQAQLQQSLNPLPGPTEEILAGLVSPTAMSQILAQLRPNPAASYANASHLNTQIQQQLAISPDHGVNVHRDILGTPTEIIPIARMILETRRAAVSAQQQLENDAAAIDQMNAQTQARNDRVSQVLSAISGHELGTSIEAWKDWWLSQVGYRAIKDKTRGYAPTLVQNVPLSYVPTTGVTAYMGQSLGRITSFHAVSCFGAGTLVQTLTGTQPIETLQVGDRVLSQDTTTGVLGYQPVLGVHHNPPSRTFLVKVKEDTIVSSEFHRFWVAGKGWIMARDLRGGEVLRLLDGNARVDSIDDGPVQPVFNLDIAEDHDFFAGAAAALVHDNTLPDTRLAPFDAAPVLSRASR